jgi:hypothetical protein
LELYKLLIYKEGNTEKKTNQKDEENGNAENAELGSNEGKQIAEEDDSKRSAFSIEGE